MVRLKHGSSRTSYLKLICFGQNLFYSTESVCISRDIRQPPKALERSCLIHDLSRPIYIPRMSQKLLLTEFLEFPSDVRCFIVILNPVS